MDLYSKKSRWKMYLAIVGSIIVLTSLVYTNYLTGKLAHEEQNKAEIMKIILQEINNENVPEECEKCRDLTPYLAIIQRNTSIPVMLVADNQITGHINFASDDPAYLQRELQRMRDKGVTPIEDNLVGVQTYYKESIILTQLRYFPIVQLFLIAAFIMFGYLSFSNARRAEQNRVWVGMAKETAHQLGTPISGIVAWIEHLRIMREDDEEMKEVLSELDKDVNRLELIADRFSKIGSAPKLDPVNIYQELEGCRAYMQRRAPRKVEFHFPSPDQSPLMVNINPHLFDWVIENLLRNALDAMGNRGTISAKVTEEGDYITIDLTDTGKGIPASRFKTVFQPGYTTKKRGWGLGLSLAKRIIEEYHSGKIFVKKSEEHKGTTFTIKLPKR